MKKSVRTIISLLLAFSALNACLFAQDDKKDEEKSVQSASPAQPAQEPGPTAQPQPAQGANLNVSYKEVRSHSFGKENVRVFLDGSSASYTIAALDSEGGKNYILAPSSACSNSFLLKIGNKVYNLSASSVVKKTVRKLEEGGQLGYTIKKKANVIVDFTLVETKESLGQDAVKVTAYVTNLSSKMQAFSLKGIFDTVLGERIKTHFTTGNGRQLTSEEQILDMENEKSLYTTDGNTWAQFYFSAPGLTTPDAVTVSNRGYIEKANWLPSAVSGRSFNSISYLNNSVICVNWPVLVLKAGQTGSLVFYIFTGHDGIKPDGNSFFKNGVVPAPVVEKTPVAESPVSSEPEKSEAQPEQKEEVPEAENKILPPEEPKKSQNVPAPQPEKADFEFIVPPVTDAQLDPEYVQDLIDRINSLQSDPDLVDHEEVSRLNAELDAILLKLKQRM